MVEFEHYSVEKIIFGSGSIAKLRLLMEELNAKLRLPAKYPVLVVGGSHAKAKLLPQIAAQIDQVETFILPPGEPELATVNAGIEAAKKVEAKLVIGAGGGSVLDTAKAIAGLAKLSGNSREYFFGRAIEAPSLPWIGIPTTAGSGAEVTNNSVLIHDGKKQSIRSPYWFARAVIVDPALTLSLPAKQTAISGMDALTHAVEGYLSRYSNSLTELLSLQAVKLVAENLPLAVEDGGDLKAREAVLMGSMLSAQAFVNSKLGLVHGLAHPIGVKSDEAHGLICGLLLPHVYLYNLPVLGAKGRALAEIWQVSKPEAVAEKIWELLAKFGLPTKLREIGIQEQDLPQIIEDTLPSASTAANPRAVNEEELQKLLLEAL